MLATASPLPQKALRVAERLSLSCPAMGGVNPALRSVFYAGE